MKYKKGEVIFYKKHSPAELLKMAKIFPNIQDRIKSFRSDYIYDPKDKTWAKKGTAKSFRIRRR